MMDRFWCWSWGGALATALALSIGAPSMLQVLPRRKLPNAPSLGFAFETKIVAGRGAAILSGTDAGCKVLVYSGESRNDPPVLNVSACTRTRQISWRIAR